MTGQRMSDFNEQWVQTDTKREAVSALEMVYEQLDHVQNDPHRWKWVILALHNAVQNFMILALRGTNNLNVMRESDAEAWLDAYNNNQQLLPSGKLLDFLDLYKKIKGDTMEIGLNSRRYVPKGQEGRSIKQLNRLRNAFIHYMPKIWLIELPGLPGIGLDCVRVIDFLVNDSQNILLEEEDRQELQQLLCDIENSLTLLSERYKQGIQDSTTPAA